MQNEPVNNPLDPAGLQERREEFLVSARSRDPRAGGEKLAAFVDIARMEASAEVLKTIDNGQVLRTVVMSCTPALAFELSRRFPDLNIERNQPLQMF